MVFDDDVKLLGLYSRYEDEPGELQAKVVQYISGDTFQEQGKNEELNDVRIKRLIGIAIQPDRQCDGRQEASKNEGHTRDFAEISKRRFVRERPLNQFNGL